MLANDNIFNFLKAYTFPINRGDLTTIDFLKTYFSNYTDNLKIAISSKDDRFLRDELYSKLSNKIDFIEKICNKIIVILEKYNETNIIEHHKLMSNLMEDMEDELYIKTYDITKVGLLDWFYRIRHSDINIQDRHEMFHVPLDKRYLINSYRYSIAGHPSLYLSTSLGLAWFEAGMPNKFSCSKFSFEPKNKKPLRLINFSPSPTSLLHSIELSTLNAKEDKDLYIVI